MSKRQRKYTDDERAAAMALLESFGGNVAKTARQSGFPENTIRNWRDGKGMVPPEVVANKKDDLADLFEREAIGALGMAAAKRESASYRDLVTGAAIAADKIQLLRGEPTERIAHDGLTPDEAVEVARRLRMLPGGKAKSA